MRNSSTSSFSVYLSRLFVVQAFLLLAFMLASLALVKYVVEPNDTLISRLEFIKSATATNAAFGDSHMVWGFVGSPEFPTLGMEGETIPDMELRVRFYFQDKQPRKIIVQGDPHSFAPYKLERTTHGYLEDMGDSFLRRFVEYHREYLGLYWTKVLVNRSLQVFRPKYRIQWGWIAGAGRWSSVAPPARVQQAIARVKRQTPVEKFWHHEFAKSYLRSIAFLKSRGADICVVTMPVSYEYHKHAVENPTVAAAIDFFRESAEQNKARYVNFFDLYARPEFNDYFRDEDHLNQVGAPIFTKKVLSSCFGHNGAGA